jgi:hypothetical protein
MLLKGKGGKDLRSSHSVYQWRQVSRICGSFLIAVKVKREKGD